MKTKQTEDRYEEELNRREEWIQKNRKRLEQDFLESSDEFMDYCEERAREVFKKDEDCIVKCDDCKKTIKENATFRESVAGGHCSACRGKELKTEVLK